MNKHEKMLRAHVEGFDRLIGGKNLIYKTLLEKGEMFRGRKLPKAYKTGEPKNCFENALKLASSTLPWLYYVEGLAFRKGLNVPLFHAWAADDSLRVVDPTWTRPEDCVYFGVKMLPGNAWTATGELGYFGILENLWRKPGKAEAIIRNATLEPTEAAS